VRHNPVDNPQPVQLPVQLQVKLRKPTRNEKWRNSNSVQWVVPLFDGLSTRRRRIIPRALAHGSLTTDRRALYGSGLQGFITSSSAKGFASVARRSTSCTSKNMAVHNFGTVCTSTTYDILCTYPAAHGNPAGLRMHLEVIDVLQNTVPRSSDSTSLGRPGRMDTDRSAPSTCRTN
jgi:hypothetical protein